MIDEPGNETDSEFEARVQQVLGAEADRVPAEVADRLAAMRRDAVAAFDERRRPGFGFGWGALAAAVATVTLAAGLLLFRGTGSVPEMPGIVDEPEFAAAQDLELLSELEFLAWLEEQSSGAG